MSVPAASRFLRYQFDSPAQLRRHSRLLDGRVLLFFPEQRPRLPERTRTLLEICFSRSSQQVALPAMVYARDLYGATPGMWLELRALSIVAGLQAALVAPRRKRPRLGMDLVAWVQRQQGASLACPVLDVSEAGARLWGVPGNPPRRNEELIVRLPDCRAVRGRVAWAHGREVGIEFGRDARLAAATVFARAAEQWSGASLAVHDRACTCTSGGAPRDPPLKQPLLKQPALRNGRP